MLFVKLLFISSSVFCFSSVRMRNQKENPRMIKLLNTLFVINEDAYLTLDGENLVVTRNKQETCLLYTSRCV